MHLQSFPPTCYESKRKLKPEFKPKPEPSSLDCYLQGFTWSYDTGLSNPNVRAIPPNQPVKLLLATVKTGSTPLDYQLANTLP